VKFDDRHSFFGEDWGCLKEEERERERGRKSENKRKINRKETK
jgi:hypothetical protein